MAISAVVRDATGVSPAVPFYSAAAVGAVGVALFAATVDEAHAE